MSDITSTDTGPENYDQERWNTLKDTLRKLPNEDAIVSVLTLRMLGFEVEGPDVHPTAQDALIETARTYPVEVTEVAFFAVAQGMGLF